MGEVKVRRAIALVVLLSCMGAADGERGRDARDTVKGRVDFLDYFLQKDDVDEAWTLGGTDVRADTDPDGTGAQTYVLNKFSQAECYEVFKVIDDQLQIRYEVNRPKNSPNHWWVRRYEGIDAKGEKPGAVWCERYVEPGAAPKLFKWKQDRFEFHPWVRKEYVVDKNGSAAELSSYVSFRWTNDDWGNHNRTGFELNPVLRLVSEWQHEGMIVELYDYSKGKGLVAWAWLERISTLVPLEADRSGKLYKCENGIAYVESKGDERTKPMVWKYDPRHGHKGIALDVTRFQSTWKKDLGPQWYGVFRDSIREAPLWKKKERIEHDFSLPEWKSKPGATIGDLKGYYTEDVK